MAERTKIILCANCGYENVIVDDVNLPPRETRYRHVKLDDVNYAFWHQMAIANNLTLNDMLTMLLAMAKQDNNITKDLFTTTKNL